MNEKELRHRHNLDNEVIYDQTSQKLSTLMDQASDEVENNELTPEILEDILENDK
jgi:hypothetical protein